MPLGKRAPFLSCQSPMSLRWIQRASLLQQGVSSSKASLVALPRITEGNLSNSHLSLYSCSSTHLCLYSTVHKIWELLFISKRKKHKKHCEPTVATSLTISVASHVFAMVWCYLGLLGIDANLFHSYYWFCFCLCTVSHGMCTLVTCLHPADLHACRHRTFFILYWWNEARVQIFLKTGTVHSECLWSLKQIRKERAELL